MLYFTINIHDLMVIESSSNFFLYSSEMYKATSDTELYKNEKQSSSAKTGLKLMVRQKILISIKKRF